ncbi:DUF4349 domain-containing protein [Mucilaginibacter gossypii]|uniref:DUF4349 domain-containing protein n=1 Tax=Mucilaginibacter gossypii TaxID=551996 RepID=UPI000DCD30BB|nr:MULTISPECIES: DUF4349 domain-containing protein [Mucilaginibacter]QTE35745.1 DUF4349 domain-containing protein [Mucilaginibacter gossypii]RAV56896.1 hypothetical protein DIU36_14085 [Mucilaginibacter rubeus]
MKTYFFLSISFLLLLMSCKHETEQKVNVANVELVPPPPAGEKSMAAADQLEDAGTANKPTASNPSITDTAKKIIKEGDIRFETDNPKAARQNIVSSLKKLGGYLAEENETNSGETNQKEYSLKIRIPSKNFDAFLNSLTSSTDHIESKNIHIRDVTTQFIDVRAEISNNKQLEQRYLQLAAKATKMTDLLAIEDKLASIRTSIDSAQGQLNYLSSQVSYSSLDISFYTRHPGEVNTGNGFAYKFKTAIGEGWEVLQNLFFALIALWPLMIGAIIFLLLIRRWKRRRKANIISEA